MATGKQIKFYREKLGWTLQVLSDESGVDLGTIAALELRDSSRSKYFTDLAKALGLTLDQLTDTSNIYTPNPPKKPTTLTVNEAGTQYKVSKGPDQWITEAVATLEKLNEADRRAAVLNLRTFVLALDPHKDGQALQMAG
jgi:transcriptional regulator with XRE-family HTH domain